MLLLLLLFIVICTLTVAISHSVTVDSTIAATITKVCEAITNNTIDSNSYRDNNSSDDRLLYHAELLSLLNYSLTSNYNSYQDMIRQRQQHQPSLTVIVLTRATVSTYSYSIYSLLTNSIYSLLHNYLLLPLLPDSSTTDYNYHRKLVPLAEAMGVYDSRTVTKYADYYVWIDAGKL